MSGAAGTTGAGDPGLGLSTADRLLPADLVERARAFSAGSVPVAPARPAATVALLRDGPTGVEAYLLRRVPTMAFAAGMHVFPGGGVDPRDAETGIAWAGSPPQEWARTLGTDAPTARELVCAALRETFEESGVLLAGATPDAVVPDTTGEDWEADREALIGRTLAFAELLARRRLVLRTDLLRAWSRWVTPEFEPRRYDTVIFLAALPAEQRTRFVGGEADHVAWVRPDEAVRAFRAGRLPMLPPTLATLAGVAGAASVAEALARAAGRSMAAVVPRPVLTEDGAYVLLPGEPGYDDAPAGRP